MTSHPRLPTVRPATAADAAAIGQIHVTSWQAAYAGQLPDGFLRTLSVSDRQRTWEKELTASDPRSGVLVVEHAGHVVGFASVGASRDPDATADTGELHAIYLEPAVWRRGLGRLLHDHALDLLIGNGYQRATLWVLRSNTRARRFYASAGWTPDGATKTDTIAGGEIKLEELRYSKSLIAPSIG